MCKFEVRELGVCNEHNQIPNEVLRNILLVYKFGKKEAIKNLPNDLICDENGNFWTTWSMVMKIREEHKDREKER